VHFNARFNPRYHDQRVLRLKPRYNEAVNGHWICDEGRYSYPSIDASNRLRDPRVKRNGGYREVSWQEAVQDVAGSIKQALAKGGPAGIALLLSPQMSNEELFRVRQIFRDQLGAENIASRVPDPAPVYSDNFLITADKNPNTHGVATLHPGGMQSEELLQACAAGRIRFLYIFQQDLTRGFDPARVREALGKVDCVVFQGTWDQPTAGLANIQLPSAAYAEKEGTFTNLQGRVQRFNAAVPPTGQSLPDLDIFAQLAHELGMPLTGASAEEVFNEMGQSVDTFAGMTWQAIGKSGQLLKHESGK
jgi:NADH-quinone oxidoreductase subunit G